MSLKGIFSGRDLLSFHCEQLFIAAWSTPRAGRRAGGRKPGRPGGLGDSPAWEAASAPPGAASADRAKGPAVRARRASKESPPAPTRKRHSSPRPPRPAAAAAAHGVPPRCAAWRAARGRRQLTGGTAPQQQPRPPKEPEPEPERAGPEERLTGQRLPRSRLPDTAPPATVPQALERGGEDGEPSAPWAFLSGFWKLYGVGLSVSVSVSVPPESRGDRRGADPKGKQRLSGGDGERLTDPGRRWGEGRK